MGASSVTGVGQGDASGGIKGPGNGRNYFVPQVTPHVVAAGNATLVYGALTVTFPTALAESKTKYAVVVTGTAAAARVSTKTDNSDDQFASFRIAGTGTDTVAWMVVNTGYGLDA